MSFNLIDTIKQVSLEVINNQASNVRFGTVTNLNPLTVRMNDYFTLTNEFLVLDSPVELNENVILLKDSMSDKYLVLSTIEKVYQTTINIGGEVRTGHVTADKVWSYFKAQGYSDAATAGILGNMMRECGGDTLNINGTMYGKYAGVRYYGLIMWSLRYFPQVDGKSVDWQISYLHTDFMPYQFRLRAKYYKRGFTLEQFKNMTNVEEAAKAFAIIVENPGPEGNGTYPRRRKNAKTAYNHYHN